MLRFLYPVITLKILLVQSGQPRYYTYSFQMQRRPDSTKLHAVWRTEIKTESEKTVGVGGGGGCTREGGSQGEYREGGGGDERTGSGISKSQ